MKGLEETFRKLTKLRDNLKDLTVQESREIFTEILNGTLSQIKTAAFLTAMRIKGETPQELIGVIEAIRETMKPLSASGDALDLAPNYDGKVRTIYVLPSALWICSKLGSKFTNHYALSVPVKEGVTLYEVVRKLGTEINIRFVSQEEYAPKLYRLMDLRRELGFRTLINTVEKFLNPFGAGRVVVSVFHKPYFEKNGEVLDRLGFEDYTIIKGVEGGLEPHTDRPTLVKRKGKEIEVIDPSKLGLELPKNVQTDRVLDDSVEINRRIIEGEERGEFFNWAVYTAGLLLYAGGKVGSVKEGIDKIVATKL